MSVRKTPGTIYIYGLRCPLSGEIRYVGKTARPAQRLRQHLCKPPDTHKGRWIKKLLAAGLEPTIEILEAVPVARWRGAERAWIAALTEAGNRLTNIARGGDGVGTFTDETRAKMSASRKAWFAALTAEEQSTHRARLALIGKTYGGTTATPESIAQLRERNRNRVWDEASRVRTGADAKERWAALSDGERDAINRKRSGAMTGRVASDETRAKMSVASTGRIASEAARERQRDIRRAHWANATPEEKRAAHLRMTAAYTEDSQAKRSASLLGSKRRKNASSQYVGVGWLKDKSKWRALITIDGKPRYLGAFESEEEAAKRYDAAARELIGPHARTNFPEVS